MSVFSHNNEKGIRKKKGIRHSIANDFACLLKRNDACFLKCCARCWSWDRKIDTSNCRIVHQNLNDIYTVCCTPLLRKCVRIRNLSSFAYNASSILIAVKFWSQLFDMKKTTLICYSWSLYSARRYLRRQQVAYYLRWWGTSDSKERAIVNSSSFHALWLLLYLVVRCRGVQEEFIFWQ